jgi:uncharacterized protein YndB with AHSA1/START domain
MELRFDVYAKIARPIATVFEAVTDPKQLSAYFTTGGSSGPLREGARVLWKFGMRRESTRSRLRGSFRTSASSSPGTRRLIPT